MEGYDVLQLRVEFENEEVPWMYPIALEGRTVSGIFVNNIPQGNVKECTNVDEFGCYFKCSECQRDYLPVQITRFTDKLDWHRCPNCGAKIRGGE